MSAKRKTLRVIVKNDKGRITDVFEQKQTHEHWRAYYIPMVLRRKIYQHLEAGEDVYLEISE